MSEALQLSRLANHLLKELEEIQEDPRLGESTHSRLIEVVLEHFSEVENILLQRHINEHKSEHSPPTAEGSDQIN